MTNNEDSNTLIESLLVSNSNSRNVFKEKFHIIKYSLLLCVQCKDPLIQLVAVGEIIVNIRNNRPIGSWVFKRLFHF